MVEPDVEKPLSMMRVSRLTSSNDQQKNKRATTFGSCI